jgi:murein DD-endopeptidase MepM/ murein hydrolase activator NlpD
LKGFSEKEERVSQTFLLYLSLTLVTGFASHSFASADVSLVWDDTRGFVNEAQCVPLHEAQSQPLPETLKKYLAFVIHVSEIVPAGNPAPFDVNDSYWQVAGDKEDFIRCLSQSGFKDYLIFNVYRSEMPDPLAQVGVSADQVLIFKYAKVLAIQDAEQFIEEGSAQASTSGNSLVQGVDAVEGPLEYVVCTSGPTLNVRDESLERILFQAKRFEVIKPVQSFGVDRIEKVINGVKYTFVKVQVPSQPVESNQGWIADEYLKLRSECPGAEKPVETEEPKAPGWVFPLNKRTSENYKTGMRRFAANRSNGRLHAAADLYRVKGEAAVAANNVTVIRDLYYFYQGTYAIEVRASNGRVIRYGEIQGRLAPGVGLNKSVRAGQTVGYIGKVNSDCCTPMLHFEMYSGRLNGALTQNGNKYQRRPDLMDPSGHLTDWEKEKFGRSY